MDKQTKSDEQRIVPGEVAREVDQYTSKLVLVGPGHYVNKIKDMESAFRGDETFLDIFENEEVR